MENLQLSKKIITITIIPKIIFEMIGIVAIVSVLYTLVEKNHSTTYIITVIGFFTAVSYRIIPSFQKLIACYQQISFSKAVLKKLETRFESSNLS